MEMQLVNVSALVCLLGACGGSGGGSGIEIPTFDNAFAVASASGAALERIDDLSPSTGAQVPTSGSAIYSGTILIGDADLTPEVIGGMAIEVDFANEANIDGAAGSFFDADGSAVGGSLELSSPSLIGTNSETRLTGNLQGRLSDVTVDGSDEDVVYNLAIGGSFLGSDAEAIAGGLTGTADIEGGGGGERRDGTFVLEQD